MRVTGRHIGSRKAPVAAKGMTAPAPTARTAMQAAARIDALKRLIAAGEYKVNARAVAERIFKSAGVPLP